MINHVKLNLSKGYYEIVKGTDFCITSDNSSHLVYEKDGVWTVLSDPDGRHNGNSVIMLPDDAELKSLVLYGDDIALKCDCVRAEMLYIDLKNSACEFESIKGGEIGIAMGKGDARFNIKALESLKVDCGYGTVNIDLPAMPCGYNITSRCGMGEVTLNSQKLPRIYVEPKGEKIINILCGMGDVNMNTYKK